MTRKKGNPDALGGADGADIVSVEASRKAREQGGSPG